MTFTERAGILTSMLGGRVYAEEETPRETSASSMLGTASARRAFQMRRLLLSKGIGCLLRREFHTVSLIAEILGVYHRKPVWAALFRWAAATMRHLPPVPAFYVLVARVLRAVAPDRAPLFQACASVVVRGAVARLARDSRGKRQSSVAILGAGRHTQWLLLATGLHRVSVRAILVSDTTVPPAEFCGLPVRPLDEAQRLGLTHVLVAIPEPSPQLSERLAELESLGVTIVNPFSDLASSLSRSTAPSVPLEHASSLDGEGQCPLVAYLTRYAEGLAPFERFIASYRNISEPLPHQLLIVFKGFPSADDTATYRRQLEGLVYRELHVADTGFDIGSYLEVFRRFRFPSYLFLGSFCVLRSAGWLTLMDRCLRTAPRAGVVAASGSWAAGITCRFPNYHVRTAAFLVPENVLRAIKIGPMRIKRDAYEFEHGDESLTRQVLRMGLEPFVVGRDGRHYPKEEWPNSKTFFGHDQENLLISDNRTEDYDEADTVTRWLLSEGIWGPFRGQATVDVPSQGGSGGPAGGGTTR